MLNEQSNSKWKLNHKAQFKAKFCWNGMTPAKLHSEAFTLLKHWKYSPNNQPIQKWVSFYRYMKYQIRLNADVMSNMVAYQQKFVKPPWGQKVVLCYIYKPTNWNTTNRNSFWPKKKLDRKTFLEKLFVVTPFKSKVFHFMCPNEFHSCKNNWQKLKIKITWNATRL